MMTPELCLKESALFQDALTRKLTFLIQIDFVFRCGFQFREQPNTAV